MAGITAFRESYMGVQEGINEDDFGTYEARRLRYSILWSVYENTAYRRMHTWAQSYKATYGLYRYVRNIYNPAYRIGVFWKSHIWGGRLDPAAGDGKTVPSALPIVTDNEAIRPALAQIWRWSNWQTKKDVVALKGSILGDAAIKVVDDTDRRKVYLKFVHPGTIKEVTLDPFGNVKAYTIEETRPHPDKQNTDVTYTEIATRDGDDVIYTTYLNGSPYPWDGGDPSWSIPYGFIPLVLIQHDDAGYDWGWSELHPALSKFREVDDLASKLSDQIRKMVDAPWLFSGVSAPSGKKTTGSERTSDAPEAGREDVPALYGPAGSGATPLVAPLDISSTTAYIQTILQGIEKDFPELADDLHNVQGDISGRALRINREPVENKVFERRARYDDALVRVQQMALTIGGFRNYQGFAGFGLQSYAAGDLEHSIADRDAFKKDPTLELDYEKQFWDVANQAKTFGLPPTLYLKRNGWSEEDIKEFMNSPEYQSRLAAMEASRKGMEAMQNSEAGKVNNLPSRFGNQDNNGTE